MKTIVRFILAAAALGSIGFLAGCATQRMAKITKVTPFSFEIKVVDSSSARRLPPEELGILKANIVRYLADQGEQLVAGTRYYLRVDFAPDKPGLPAEWLLVEVMTPMEETATSVLATYKNNYTSPYYYQPYTRPGYSTYYSSYADSYYDSYRSAYYPPPPVTPNRDHRPHDRNDGDKRRAWNGNGNDNDRRPGTYTRGNGNDRDRDRDHRPRTTDNTPRSDDSPRWRGRDTDNSGSTTARNDDRSSGNSGGGGGSSHTPPPSPAPSYNPPPSTPSSSNDGIQKMSAQTEEN